MSSPRVFLCHSGDGAAAALELAGLLRQAGLEVWLDAEEVEDQEDWNLRTADALAGADVFGVFIGETRTEQWAGRELRLALERHAEDPGFRIIPILGPGASPDELPFYLAQHQWLDLRKGLGKPADLQRLVGAILERPPESVALIPPDESPFRGLMAFDVAHAHLFFGRDDETAELLERLGRSRFLAVIGSSGSGKSSLIRAGLVPALRRGRFRGEGTATPRWLTAILRPGDDPFRELANALLELAPEGDAAARIERRADLVQRLGDGARGLAACLAELSSGDDALLLYVDQFEELFTQTTDHEKRALFIETLLKTARRQTTANVWVLISLRADFFAHCFAHADLPNLISANQYAVQRMSLDSLRDAIEAPARMAGATLESGLAERILEEVGDQPGNLPLLGHTLLELWERRAQSRLTHHAYDTIGGLCGALEHRAEAVYETFDADEKRVARKLLLSLAVPGREAGSTRQRVARGKLAPGVEDRTLVDGVLSRLVEERLLVVGGAGDGEGEGEEEVEVAHEALIRGWRRLQRWLDADREFLHWRQRAQASLAAWHEAGRDRGALLRGAPLAVALEWARQRREDLDEPLVDFLRQSASRERRMRWLSKAAVIAIAVAGSAAIILAILATRSQNRAETNLGLATSAVDEMLIRVGSESLDDVPQMEAVRKELLDRARTFYEEFREQKPSDPALKLQAALAPFRLGEIDRLMGDSRAAESAFREAIDGVGEMAASDPENPAFRRELANLHNWLGVLLGETGSTEEDAQEAGRQYERAIELQKELTEELPAESDYVEELARSLYNRGILRAERLENPEGALADYWDAIELLETLQEAPTSEIQPLLQHLARTYNNLGNLLATQKRRDAAEQAYQAAAALFERLHEEDGNRRDYEEELARTLNNLADLVRRTGDAQAADALNSDALRHFARLADPLPGLRSELANAHNLRGSILEDLERYQEAARSYGVAADSFAALCEEFPDRADFRWRYAVALTNLGNRQSRLGDERAVETARELSELLPKLSADQRGLIEGRTWYKRVAPSSPPEL